VLCEFTHDRLHYTNLGAAAGFRTQLIKLRRYPYAPFHWGYLQPHMSLALLPNKAF
jgi:hypothetical protein